MKPLVYFQADYTGLELYTFSQCSLAMLGYSEMAKALNAGNDVHSMLAAKIMGISYEDAMKRKKAKEPEFGKRRDTSKIGNFGYLGGMGPPKFVFSARKQYGVIIPLQEAKDIKHGMKETWIELVEYQARAGAAIKSGETKLIHPMTDFVRETNKYTEWCNSPFQHLAACVATRALYLVTKHCYTEQPCAACEGAANGCEWCRPCHGPGISPLYGMRCANFVHDEIIGECCEEWGHEVAHELARLMKRGAEPYLPDVPAKVEPQLMRYWSKNASEVWKDGRLVPWDGREQEKKAA